MYGIIAITLDAGTPTIEFKNNSGSVPLLLSRPARPGRVKLAGLPVTVTIAARRGRHGPGDREGPGCRGHGPALSSESGLSNPQFPLKLSNAPCRLPVGRARGRGQISH